MRGLSLPELINAPDDAGKYEGDFVTVAQYPDPINVQTVRSCLEASRAIDARVVLAAYSRGDLPGDKEV